MTAPSRIQRVAPACHELSVRFREGMRVPVRVFATEKEPGSYAFVDGATSDLTFVALGPTLDATFVAAAQALLAATVEDPDAVASREHRTLTLEEPDLELLLLRFLSELVYLRDAEDLLLRLDRVRVREGSPARLEGERIDAARHALAADVKAATAHGLRVAPTEGGYTAEVTLDV